MAANDLTERNGASERDVLEATLHFNTLVFGAILGAFAGTSLLVLSLIAAPAPGRGGLVVALIGVFLPGYGSGWPGALIGLFWGFVFGAVLGAAVYRINGRNVLENLDRLVIAQGKEHGFPRAVLRLHGPSLGLAMGAVAALGLFTTTNMLVARGTATESVHARLLGEILPGYSVSVGGSIVGAVELFIVVYLLCRAFVLIYNSLAAWRQRR